MHITSKMKNMYWVLYITTLSTFLVAANAQFTEEELTADVLDLGKIRGKNITTAVDRLQVIQFSGIPYAKPALDELRFMPTELKEGPLNETGDTFYALDYGISCRQPNQLIPIPQDEDCLFLHVWTRQVYKGDDSLLRPVIVYVHGGAFTVGSGSGFSGSRLLNRDVVYVSFNYRMGLFGFFCLNNEKAPGNAAMYDMVVALKWVQKYIKYFGGDPNLVTIAGQSAGGAAITHLMISPLSQGLFHRAISSSGSALNEWATTTNPLPGSLTVAKSCECYEGSPLEVPTATELDSIADCMKIANGTCFVTGLFNYQVAERLEGRLGFEAVSPVVQNFQLNNIPPFLSESPVKVFSEGRQSNVPLLMGSNRHDGSYVLGVTYNRFLKPNNHTSDQNFMRTELLPTLLRSLGIEDDSHGVYESLARTYMGDARFTGDFDQMLPGLMDLFSVFFFKAATYQTGLLHSRKNDTYWYGFNYKGTQTLFNVLFNYVDTPYFKGGITHGDDLIYLFGLTLANFNEEERTLSNRMLDYYANFAEFGNPTPEGKVDHTIWPGLTDRETLYLSIGANSTVERYYPTDWVDAALEIFPELQPTTPQPETTQQSETTQQPETTQQSETTQQPVTDTEGPTQSAGTELTTESSGVVLDLSKYVVFLVVIAASIL